MGSITFDNINVVGNLGGGTWYPVNCEHCGPSAASVPFTNLDSLHLRNVLVTCAKCQRQIEVEAADYSFQRVAFNLLYDAGITRQQARHFARLVKKSDDLDWIIERSGYINQRLKQVAKIAKEEPQPRSALMKLVQIAVVVAGVTGAVATAITTGAGAVISSDDVWDRYRDGELFEQAPSQDPDDIQHDTEPKPTDSPEDSSSKNTQNKEPKRLDRKFGDGIEI